MVLTTSRTHLDPVHDHHRGSQASSASRAAHALLDSAESRSQTPDAPGIRSSTASPLHASPATPRRPSRVQRALPQGAPKRGLGCVPMLKASPDIARIWPAGRRQSLGGRGQAGRSLGQPEACAEILKEDQLGATRQRGLFSAYRLARFDADPAKRRKYSLDLVDLGPHLGPSSIDLVHLAEHRTMSFTVVAAAAAPTPSAAAAPHTPVSGLRQRRALGASHACDARPRSLTRSN
eukprot:scaffold6944_cov35-Phaeocystis_antarctica.AAC.2